MVAQYSDEQEQIREAICATAASLTNLAGSELFAAIVNRLTDLLDVEYAIICGFQGQESRTLAFNDHGRLLDLPLLCGVVSEAINQTRFHGNNVQKLFPGSQWLRDHAVQSLVGQKISDSEGTPVGLIAVMSKRILQDAEPALSIIEFCASRVSAEIQRQTGSQCRISNQAEILDASIGLALVSETGIILRANQRFHQIVETKSNLSDRNLGELFLPEHMRTDAFDRRAILSGAEKTIVSEKQLLTDSGKLVWTSVCYALINAGDESNLFVSVADIGEKKEIESVLEYASHYDEATGLLKRNLLREGLDRMLHDPIMKRNPIPLFLVEFDRMDLVNETFGIERGNEILREIGTRLGNRVPHPGIAARLGQHIFGFVRPHLGDVEAADAFARSIVATLTEPVYLFGQEITLLAHCGVAFSSPGVDAETWLNRASSALQASRKKGQNRIVIYSGQMQSDYSALFRMETLLRKAIRNGAFQLNFQPQVKLASGRVFGFEALLRWNDPELGHVSPATFVPLAEDLGLIGELGEWALRAACQQGVQWKKSTGRDPRISVNVSAYQIQNPRFADLVCSILRETGFSPESIELEITESKAVEDPDTTISLMYELKNAGVAFSIDDFGVAYSSLSHLTRFPIDTLKIDRLFVKDLPGGKNAEAIASCIISLGSALNLRIIAEGVESPDQARFLMTHGCQNAQGFLFVQPVDGKAAENLLLQGATVPIHR